MDITGNNQWVCIPNNLGELGEPVLLEKGSTLTTNYDDIKKNLGLSTEALALATEKEICVEFAKSINISVLTKEAAILLAGKASGYYISISKEMADILTVKTETQILSTGTGEKIVNVIVNGTEKVVDGIVYVYDSIKGWFVK